MPDSAPSRDQIIRDNMPLVYAIARRFAGRGAETGELIQAGCVGLIQAADRFDPSRGTKFSTYAVPLIMGEMRALLRSASLVRVSRSIRTLSAAVAATAERLRIQYGDEQRVEEIAAELGVSAQEAASAIASRAQAHSLDEPVGDEGLSLMDTLKDGGEPVDMLALKEALSSLNERGRRVIALRYIREYSQAEAARVLGISQPQVCRMEKRALDWLRAFLV